MTREEMARACEDVAVGAVVEDVNALLIAAAAALRQTCAWTPDEDGNWHTGCSNLHILIYGDPSENGMRFCCYCGGTLEEMK